MAKARILVIDDEDIMREYVEEALVRAGYEVATASGGEEGIAALREKAPALVVTDLKMKPMDGIEVVRQAKAENARICCIVMTAYGTIETAVAAMREGADDYILKPFAPDELELAVERGLQRGRLAEENRYLRDALNKQYDFQSMIGESAVMRKVYEQVEKVAHSKATVLVRGESGTGKELVARALHFLGERRDKPFIKVNCAALSSGLLESELFGHEKGAFTGAHEQKVGRFELAHTGSLLLDEVSEIGADLQPKLLRALQEREIDRVGGIQSIQVDARIIATSNKPLEKAVEDGDFREDLFFRLNVIPIRLPPLRERKEDIPALMDHFLERFALENGRNGLTFAKGLAKHFQAYDWPGNIRELQNAVERAVVLGDGTLDIEDFPFAGNRLKAGGSQGGGIRPGASVATMEKELILKTLDHCDGNRTRAAEMLDISVRTLRNKLKEYRESPEE